MPFPRRLSSFAILASITCLTAIGLGPTNPIQAATQEEARAVLQQWMKAAEKVESVEAEFEQLRLLSTVKVPLRKSGKIWMDKSGLFRWQVGEPPITTVVRNQDGQVTVLDGKKKTANVWSKEALLEEEKAGRGQGFAMLQSMQSPNLADFEERFDIKDAERVGKDQSASVWKFDLGLKDRKASVFVRQIEMTLDVEKGTLVSLVLVMRDKSSLATHVRSQRLNAKIPASVFAVDTTGFELQSEK
ncbi:outer membrane lipoprotein carrier protein LolA [Phragmitibacter flavus]|uniref:Outer membrane lipoprotein carrier protein LolA n=1 Tax=Phragmitibacter flavus TaxID=2576071 RepID=A0A5R8KGP3_9BACT|nr:outer membrane lipoprotein carrier protein LolA [Phragmitibacter flavus]TLD71135.1 outer membrane lipoprotein carrier protein LolA [Phragmitibacter flavus]